MSFVNGGEGKQPLVATFGGIPLRRQKNAVLTDRVPLRASSRRKELIHRRLAGQCEICGEPEKVRVHQIRKLADLDKFREPQPTTAAPVACPVRPASPGGGPLTAGRTRCPPAPSRRQPR